MNRRERELYRETWRAAEKEAGTKGQVPKVKPRPKAEEEMTFEQMKAIVRKPEVQAAAKAAILGGARNTIKEVEKQPPAKIIQDALNKSATELEPLIYVCQEHEYNELAEKINSVITKLQMLANAIEWK